MSLQTPKGAAPPLPALDLARALRRALTDDGGFTIDNRTGELCRTGVAVVVEPDVALTFPFRDWVDDTVADWLAQRWTELATRPADDEVHVGGWHDRSAGQVWLEVVRVFPPGLYDPAIALGALHRQAAIFDLCTGREIWLDGRGVKL